MSQIQDLRLNLVLNHSVAASAAAAVGQATDKRTVEARSAEAESQAYGALRVVSLGGVGNEAWNEAARKRKATEDSN